MRSAVLISALAACSTFTAPQGAREIDPPQGAATSWAYVVDCAGGVPDAWRRVEWYRVAPDPTTGLMRCWGAWTDGCFAAPATIYLLEGRETDPWLQSHELLHYRLGGDPDHTSPAWKDCAL